MEKSKKYIILNLMIMLILSAAICSLPAYAAGQAAFSIPSGAVAQGENFNVSITFSGSENIGSVDASMSYDDSAVQFVSGDNSSGGGGIVTIKGFPDSPSDSVTFSMTFKALKQGSSNMNLTNCSIFSEDGTSIGSPTAYANITVAQGAGESNTAVSSEKPDETSVSESQATTQQTTSETSQQTDANGVPTQGVLKALTVDHGTLSPQFAWNVYNYTVNVGYDVTNVEIEGTTASLSDYIWYTGTSECQVGENIRTITVTASSGEETTYTIKIIRADENEAALNQDAQDSSSGNDTNSGTSEKNTDILEQYKKILNPALAIVLIVLIIALVVVIFWIRTKLLGNSKEKKK